MKRLSSRKAVVELFRIGKKLKIHVFITDGKTAVGKIRNANNQEAMKLWEIIGGSMED
jgi:hypothetical protein